MNLTNLDNDSNTIFTLFMLAGYLTPVEGMVLPDNITLKILNLEIRKNLETICINWFNQNIKQVVSFEKYFLYNNMEEFKETLEQIVLESFSYYDIKYNKGENFYHAFVMGLLYNGSVNFQITSNRESGYGRYDLMLKPINDSCKYAYIIEFKAIAENDFDKTIEKAFKQIEEKTMLPLYQIMILLKL